MRQTLTRRQALLACLVTGIGLGAACSSPAAPAALSTGPSPTGSSPSPAPSTGIGAPSPARSPSASPSASASPSVSASVHVTQVLPSSDFGFLPTYIAQDQGFFADEGLQVDLPVMNSNAAVPALTNQQVQFAVAGSGTRAAYQGAPIRTIFYSYDFATLISVGASDVTSYQDIRGKTVAIASPGSSEDFAIRRLLQTVNIPVSDVNIIAIGQGPQRAEALLGGEIQYTVVNPDLAAKVQAQGANVLGDFHDIMPIPFSGFSVHQNELTQQTSMVKAWLRAHVRALLFIKAQPDQTADLAVQRFNLDPAVAPQAVSFILPAISSDDPGGFTEQGVVLNTTQDMQALGMTGDPAQIGLSVHDVTLLRQVQQEMGIHCTQGYMCQA